MKKFLPILFAAVMLSGCQSTFTNLSPRQQLRNTNNLYTVEVALASRQQTLRWDTIKPQVVIGSDFFPMRATSLMTNRWEALIPVNPGTNLIHYHYKFDYKFNAMGPPGNDSASSPDYTLHILDQ
jgi:hypothetical protein